MTRRAPSRPAGTPERWTIGRLALADLRHEWILSLCMVLALAAILAPLLLLLGLKNGTIETLRNRLVEDPVFRELKPDGTLALPESWFAGTARDPRVSFVVPTILRGSSIVRLAPEGSDRSEPLDLLPTAGGDPLLLENNTPIPGPDEAVLSADAADKLKVVTGKRVELQVARVRQGRRETATQLLTVAAVLPPRADPLPRVYTTLPLAMDVENYREGLAVPARGWPGGTPHAHQSFDGAYVLTPERIDPLTARTLTIGTGFTRMDPLPAKALAARTGIALPDGWGALTLEVVQTPVGWEAVRSVKDKLRGRNAVVIPFLHDSTLQLGGAAVPVLGLSLPPEQAAALGLPDLPWGPASEARRFDEYARILLPRGIAATGTVGVRLSAGGISGVTVADLPVRVEGVVAGPRAIVPSELLGALRTATQRQVAHDPAQGALLLAPAGYRGFRLYARSIDDVASLHRHLRDQGIETNAKVQAIERIRTLDRGLTRIFWLVAVVGILGGMAALVASLYAAVERKRRDLSLIRLMGLPPRSVFGFPVWQSAVLALLASGFAIGGFYALASVINGVFAGDLELGERLCHLPPSILAGAASATVVGAVLASLYAAWRSTRIDPAEAIRVE
ncbi:ABC transporter permease [Azospirillum brasilense]|uniref:ABC transporter permease n=1 Tax=Azospirillum brasilense TaxID=192 RepID=UPI001EDB5BB5|nr:FtsX-like permease family protein [Azospirillum brasilense]UKJ75378.1 FtsX-like permease family protein [Azospirillum brasilense]